MPNYDFNTTTESYHMVLYTLLNFVFGYTVRYKQTRRLRSFYLVFISTVFNRISILKFVNRVYFVFSSDRFRKKFQTGSTFPTGSIYYNANVESTLIKDKFAIDIENQCLTYKKQV